MYATEAWNVNVEMPFSSPNLDESNAHGASKHRGKTKRPLPLKHNGMKYCNNHTLKTLEWPEYVGMIWHGPGEGSGGRQVLEYAGMPICVALVYVGMGPGGSVWGVRKYCDM
jgi:hypothetical protein